VRCEDEDVEDDYDETISQGNRSDNKGSPLTAVEETSSLFEDRLFVELFPDCRLVEFSLGPKASPPTGGACPFMPTPGP
jgi:hypothetical protein